MKSLFLFFGVQLLTATDALSVRENGGNCEGVKSCRPRCVTFRLDRDTMNCGEIEGIFKVQSDINPWDIKRFTTRNCQAAGTCTNDQCGMDLMGDLTVRIAEQGHSGGFFYSTFDLLDGGDDRFTFCSIYPCTKEECSLPEQMGFELQISFYRGPVAVDDFSIDHVLGVDFYLKAAFVGSPIKANVVNRFGPLHVEWMDDPTGCRGDTISKYAPVAPLIGSPVWSLYHDRSIDPSLYCAGDEYLPADLPIEQPSAQPSAPPSSSPSSPAPSDVPTVSMSPSSAPTNSAIGLVQLDGLREFYNATKMDSIVAKGHNNWFTSSDYCSFTGITCDDRGYVIRLDMQSSYLAGSLPASMKQLQRIRQINVFNNRITGPIPEYLCELEQLTQVELATNLFNGTLPFCLHRLRYLRRLMLQYNSFTGEIPREFCQFNQLEDFDVSYNIGLYGEIPQCMGSLLLNIFRVDNVGLVGQVPPQLCAKKNINFLNPNPYGCAAIACPAGTYQPVTGRHFNNVTNCIPCDFPSNVIGSTSCRFVQNNTVLSVTATPSLSPSHAPSGSDVPVSVESDLPSSVMPNTLLSTVPSATPSLAPSAVVTSQDTASPSLMESSSPTVYPSITPSHSPTLGDEVVVVTAVFPGIQGKLDASGVNTFESTTMVYLSSNARIERVTVLNQSTGDTLGNTRVNARRLNDALAIEMEIEGRSDTGTLESQMENMLVEKFSDYSMTLKKALPVLAATSAPTPAPTTIQKQSETVPEAKRKTNWWLLGAAVALSVVAVVAVLFVRETRRKHRESVRAFPVEQTAIASGSISSPPPRAPQPRDDAMSSESSSGWNSISSPGALVEDQVVRDWSHNRNDSGMQDVM